MPNLLITNSNYLRLWIGQALAAIGNKIYMIALPWYFVNALGDSRGLTIMLCSGTLPILLLGPLAGPYIDRWNKRHIMIVSDLISCLLTAAVAAAVHWRAPSLFIYLLVFLLGIASVFFQPATRSLIPCLVREEQIQQATSLHAGMNQLSALLGAALGGIVVGWWSVRTAVLLNSCTYLASAVASLLIRYRPPEKSASGAKTSILEELVAGFRYVRGQTAIFRMLLIAAFFNIFIMAIFVFLPILISDYLKLPSSAYGIADAMLSVGAILAALWLSIRDVSNHLFWIKAGLGTCGLTFLVLGTGKGLVFVLVGMGLFGCVLNVVNINAFSFFTKEVDAAFHGRFFNLMETISSGTFPLSFLLAGVLARHYNIYSLFVVNGAAMLLLGAAATLLIRSKETPCST